MLRLGKVLYIACKEDDYVLSSLDLTVIRESDKENGSHLMNKVGIIY